MIKGLIWPMALLLLGSEVRAQVDTAKQERFSFHFQNTIIGQYKPSFSAPYSGQNSLQPGEETQVSVTATLFTAARLWKGATLVFNPEMSGGSGLSSTLGLGAATNGETFRVGDPKPAVYLARLYLRQLIPLGGSHSFQQGDANQPAAYQPDSYISLTAGKISLTDFFDANDYSHDPRSQFMNWALMASGAWDYAANTRGYTPGFLGEWVTPRHELRYVFALLPKTANGNVMNWDMGQSASQTLEYSYKYHWRNHPGKISGLAFYNYAGMGDYRQAVANTNPPDVIATRNGVRSKVGGGLNFQQELTPDVGIFARASMNDGRHETWAFTEIDNSISGGVSVAGTRWHRAGDTFGAAWVNSGLSDPHRDYLAAGGYGFMLGDGQLNYGRENA